MMINALRARGWVVAVHNDYRLDGELHTFWLFTKGDRCAKGEGTSDEAALEAVVAEVDRIEAAGGGVAVAPGEMASAILAFCERAHDLSDPDPATRASFARVLALGNRLRPVGKTCGNQSEDYPDLRCTRRSHHSRRHSNGGGASW
jgi:hypothetical protein